MTTATSASRIRHDSDAAFQEWVQEMTLKLAECGLVQTADTGQINPGSATRPAINTSAGYQIWRFNDALQATAPVFLRIEYRTGSVVTNPAMFLGVGTSTNGAGTLGGVTWAPAAMATMNASQTTDTLRNSYWCHTNGFFGMDWKAGAGATETQVLLARSVNPTTGAPTNEGLMTIRMGNNFLGYYTMKFTAPTEVLNTGTVTDAQICHWPMLQNTSSLVGLDPQVSLAWMPIRRVTPVVGIVGCRDAEFTPFNTFTFTPIGSTPHTYIALSNFPHMSGGGFLKAAMLWE